MHVTFTSQEERQKKMQERSIRLRSSVRVRENGDACMQRRGGLGQRATAREPLPPSFRVWKTTGRRGNERTNERASERAAGVCVTCPRCPLERNGGNWAGQGSPVAAAHAYVRFAPTARLGLQVQFTICFFRYFLGVAFGAAKSSSFARPISLVGRPISVADLEHAAPSSFGGGVT